MTPSLPRSARGLGARSHRGVRAGRTSSLRVACTVALPPKQLKVKRIMGEGSFGQVFEGTFASPQGEERIVMKRVKARVEGAEEMHEMELALNQYAAKVARGHCAHFIGYCTVTEKEATASLTPGMWLMWKYEGSRTLSYYLRRRDFARALSLDLQVPEEAVVATIMKQLFEGLAAFHAAGLVHRDVKPMNIIFAEEERRFKLIDLGACADLRTGTNYVPDESILDPQYAPPEKYVLPTDSPHLSKSLLKTAVSPMLWFRFKPDRFDMWSVGMVMLQLALPTVRTDRGLKQFNSTYGDRYKYDLQAWRQGSSIPRREWEVLDADNGAGWELLQSLLRERSIETDDDGAVVFTDKGEPRLSASEALKHRFMRQAAEEGSGTTQQRAAAAAAAAKEAAAKEAAAAAAARPAARGGSAQRLPAASTSGRSLPQPAPTASKAGAFSQAVGLWRGLTSKLFDLEAQIMTQASATEKQTTKVQRLKQAASPSAMRPGQLEKEEQVLQKMERRLDGLQKDFDSTANAASGILGFLGGLGAAAAGTAGGSRGTGGQQGRVAKAAGGTGGKVAGGTGGKVVGVPDAKSGNVQLWQKIADRMAEIESKLNNQESAVDKQSFTVKKLRQQVNQGAAPPDLLKRAERTLSRMEQRLDALAREKDKTKEQASSLMGMLGGLLGGGGSGGGTGQQQQQPVAPPAPLPPPSAAAAAAVMAAARAGEKGKGTAVVPPAPVPSAGGFWRGLFGGGTQAQKQQPQAPAAPKAAAPAAAQPAAPTQPDAAAPAAAAAPTPAKPAAPAAPDASSAAGLLSSWGGMAARLAVGVASSLKDEAERQIRSLEAAQEAKRAQQAKEAAFRALLRERNPPVTTATTYDQLVETSGSDPRFVTMEDARRRLALALHVKGLIKVEQAARARARAELKAVLRRSGLSDSSQWDVVKARMERDPLYQAVYTAVTPEEDRRAVFEEIIAELRQAREATERVEEAKREAAARAQQERAERAAAAAAARVDAETAVGAARQEMGEFAFMEVLSVLRPAVTAASTWAEVQARIPADAAARLEAVPDRRRVELFNVYVAQVAQREAAKQLATEQAAQKAVAAARAEQERVERAAERAAAAAREAARKAAEDAEKAEEGYMEMLAALKPALEGDCLWPHVKPRIMREPCFLAVPDRRRRELFELFVAGVREATAAAEAAAAAAAQKGSKAGGGKPGEAQTVAAAAVDMGRIETLRKEQARLRAEYEKMEAKLREMERLMQAKEATQPQQQQQQQQAGGASAAKQQVPPAPQQQPQQAVQGDDGKTDVLLGHEKDGSVVFSFVEKSGKRSDGAATQGGSQNGVYEKTRN